MRPTVQRELLLYSREGNSSLFLSELTSSLSLIVYLSVPFSLHLAEKSWQHLFFFSVCVKDVNEWWWIVSWYAAVLGIQSTPFYSCAIPLWTNRNIRWVKGQSERREVFSFNKTVLNWREPSGKRQSPQSLEQVPFVKNRMWKKSKIGQGFFNITAFFEVLLEFVSFYCIGSWMRSFLSLMVSLGPEKLASAVLKPQSQTMPLYCGNITLNSWTAQRLVGVSEGVLDSSSSTAA